MRKSHRRNYAILFLAASAVTADFAAADNKPLVVTTSQLASMNFISYAPSPQVTVLPVDSPPISGFTPQVVFTLTDMQFPEDLTSTSHISPTGDGTMPEGNYLTAGAGPYYATAVFDTGSQSHLVNLADATAFGIDDSERAGENTQSIQGASGSEDAVVSDALGVYITGFANASSNGSGTVSVGTTSILKGQTNTSILYKTADEAPSGLSNIIGSPMIAQYQGVIRNSQPQHLAVSPTVSDPTVHTVRSPQINLQPLNTPLPNGYFKLWNDVLSLNGVTPDPVFISGLDLGGLGGLSRVNPNLFGGGGGDINFADNPLAQTVWASLFADTNLSHTGGSLQDQQFLFDTGAEVSVISEQTAAKLGIFTTGPNATHVDFLAPVEGVGGTTQQVPGYYLNNITVITNGGPITWNHVPVLLLDVIDPRDGIGFVPGILGMNLFADRDLIVNGGTTDPFVGIGPRMEWATNNSGTWSDATKWSVVVPDGIDMQANFLSAIQGPKTVAVDNGGHTVGTIAFDNANSYTINGPGVITMSASIGHAQITSTLGNHTINASMTFATDTDVTVSPSTALLTINSDVTATGRAIDKIGPGTLAMKNVRAWTLTVDEGTVAILSTGSLSGASSVAMLSIAGGTSPTATLDLKDNAMVVDYTGASPLTDIAGWIKAGFAGGSWNGNGITSSLAAAIAANAGNFHKTAIGFAEGSAVGSPSLFVGQPADATSILMRYTFLGDANLDGKVDAADFAMMAGHFGQTSDFWWQGDFNNDGVVNGLDFNALASNYGQILPTAGPAVGALVPEPVGGIAILGIALAMRRRRSVR